MQNPNLTFTEEAIRPAALVEEMERLCQDDRNRLMAHRHEFVSVLCPACESNEHEQAFTKLGVRFDECKNCRTVYANPRPSLRLLHNHYANSQSYSFWAEHIFPASEATRREKIFKRRVSMVLDFCKEFAVDTDVILEVGSGFGTFCEEMETRGVFDRIIAVEPTPRLAEICRARKLEVIEAPIERISAGSVVANVVVTFETIEHLFSPREFLIACRTLLSRNGLIFITCPNMHGFDISLLREKSKSVGGEHINMFNPRSLQLLLNRCGFEVLSMTTPGVLDAELVRKSILQGVYDTSNEPFLKRLLIDEWDSLGPPFQRFLSENLMSSHMMAVAKSCVVESQGLERNL